MGYDGKLAVIPIGTRGLRTDDPFPVMDPSELQVADNVNMTGSLIEKDTGSAKYNTVALSGGSGVVGLFDFWPDESRQNLTAVTRDGKVWKVTSPVSNSEITAVSPAPTTLSVDNQVYLVPGGREIANADRKLFIMSGRDPIQVITSNGTTRSNISNPSVDWDTNKAYPYFGVVHRNRLWVFRGDDRAYASSPDDHEDFTPGGGGLQFPVGPGESERLIAAFVFKGRLYFAKYPKGLYFLDDTDVSTANWSIFKLQGDIGAASQHSIVEALGDVIIANSDGTLTSAQAIQAFGDVKTADLLTQLRVEKQVKQNANPQGLISRHVLFYAEKKRSYFTYISPNGNTTDRMLVLDLSTQTPRVSWNDRDQANCLALMKDIRRIQRPIYGSEDGFIYLMEQEDRNVGGNAYRGEFWTPDIDMGFGDKLVSEVVKNFHALEITYEASGDWDLTVEIYIDGYISQKLNFNLKGKTVLDEFVLDEDTLDPQVPLSRKLVINGSGRRISFRCFNEILGQDFRIVQIGVYYKLSSQQQRK